MDHYMLHVQESVNLTIYLYAKTMGQQRIWRVTIIARNDLRARGGLGGGAKRPHQLGVGVAQSATPTASIYIYIYLSSIYIYIFFYIYKNKLSVCGWMDGWVR